ncbi:hypothetical protein D3C71_1389400 [compost metagenome]
MIDNTVALGRINRQYRLHLRYDLISVHHQNIDGRIHEINRFMRLRRSIRTNMRRDDHIAGKAISLGLHIRQLQCGSDRRYCAVGVRYDADPARACADAAKTAYNAEGGGAAAFAFTVRARNDDFDKIGASFIALHRRYADGNLREAGEQPSHRFSIYKSAIKRVKHSQCLLKCHKDALLCFSEIVSSCNLFPPGFYRG